MLAAQSRHRRHHGSHWGCEMLILSTGLKYKATCTGKELRYIHVALENLEVATRHHPATNREVQRMIRSVEDVLPKGKVAVPVQIPK